MEDLQKMLERLVSEDIEIIDEQTRARKINYEEMEIDLNMCQPYEKHGIMKQYNRMKINEFKDLLDSLLSEMDCFDPPFKVLPNQNNLFLTKEWLELKNEKKIMLNNISFDVENLEIVLEKNRRKLDFSFKCTSEREYYFICNLLSVKTLDCRLGDKNFKIEIEDIFESYIHPLNPNPFNDFTFDVVAYEKESVDTDKFNSSLLVLKTKIIIESMEEFLNYKVYLDEKKYLDYKRDYKDEIMNSIKEFYSYK